MRILPAVVLLALLALVGCGGSESGSSSPVATTAEAGGDPAPHSSAGSGPDISGTGLDGEALSVEDFRGKPVFVNVWSSW